MSAPNGFEARLQALEERLEVRSRALEERLVQFMAREFEAVRREFAAVHRQLGLLHEVTAGLFKASQNTESEMDQVRGTQAGQQRAIEDLDRRVQRLEERDGSGQKS